ncbi:hypothetical protein ABIE78_003849 [Sinorhizobium fredii]
MVRWERTAPQPRDRSNRNFAGAQSHMDIDRPPSGDRARDTSGRRPCKPRSAPRTAADGPDAAPIRPLRRDLHLACRRSRILGLRRSQRQPYGRYGRATGIRICSFVRSRPGLRIYHLRDFRIPLAPRWSTLYNNCTSGRSCDLYVRDCLWCGLSSRTSHHNWNLPIYAVPDGCVRFVGISAVLGILRVGLLQIHAPNDEPPIDHPLHRVRRRRRRFLHGSCRRSGRCTISKGQPNIGSSAIGGPYRAGVRCGPCCSWEGSRY